MQMYKDCRTAGSKRATSTRQAVVQQQPAGRKGAHHTHSPSHPCLCEPILVTLPGHREVAPAPVPLHKAGQGGAAGGVVGGGAADAFGVGVEVSVSCGRNMCGWLCVREGVEGGGQWAHCHAGSQQAGCGRVSRRALSHVLEIVAGNQPGGIEDDLQDLLGSEARRKRGQKERSSSGASSSTSPARLPQFHLIAGGKVGMFCDLHRDSQSG